MLTIHNLMLRSHSPFYIYVEVEEEEQGLDDIYQANSKTIFMIQLLATLLLDWLVDIQTVTRLTYFDKIGYFFLKKNEKKKNAPT